MTMLGTPRAGGKRYAMMLQFLGSPHENMHVICKSAGLANSFMRYIRANWSFFATAKTVDEYPDFCTVNVVKIKPAHKEAREN